MRIQSIESVEVRERAATFYGEHQNRIYRWTDRFFAGLLILEWIAAILIAIWVSPLAWDGNSSHIHPHVWAAVIVAGLATSLPIILTLIHPGAPLTRHVIAIAQMSMSALLIHLCGGRIESHFHIFGSLAFLAFYRDWRVLMTATFVIALDHSWRGLLWPESVYGTAVASLARSLEHSAWVLFEDLFLFIGCRRSQLEMHEIAANRAELEAVNQSIELKVAERTAQLQAQTTELQARTREVKDSNHTLSQANKAMSEFSRCLEAKNVELAREREAALAADRAKSNFLANMSHEIRTPMTAVLGYTEMLFEEGDLERAPRHRVAMLQTIRRNGEHLLELINDILDLSKIDAGGMTVEQIPCAPVRLVLDVVELMQTRANDRGISLTTCCAEDLPIEIDSDPTRLRQILVNLVGNAIKFTSTGGVRIETRWNTETKSCEFDIVDSGIGIKPEHVGRLFRPFSQGDTSTTRNYGGTGLGLAISKRLAGLLGGDIVLVETTLGLGSTFRLSIAAPHAVFEQAAEASAPPAPEPTPKPVLQSLPLGTRVLVADDGPDNQRLIRHFLSKAGAEVVVVDNGQSAVDEALQRVAADNPYDVIVMDMQMPILDGYEATRLLRTKGYSGRIMALTAHAMASDRKVCLDAGCDDYLTKPIRRDELIHQVAIHAEHAKKRAPELTSV
jgi:signal transduction histidine kinase/CheY-like chemotaxis protein